MKSNFKKIAVAIAAIMTIGSLTLVSCDKEETNSSNTSTASNLSTKSVPDDELLSSDFNVAFAEGEIEDGDALQLTFDKDVFLDTYEQNLTESTGKQWVAENVKAYAQQMQSGEILPILQVSAFNVDDEKGENVFLILNRQSKGLSVPGNMFSYNPDVQVTVTCTATGTVCTSDEKFCHLILTESGKLDCSWCPEEGCTRTETGTIIIKSICRSFLAAM